MVTLLLHTVPFGVRCHISPQVCTVQKSYWFPKGDPGCYLSPQVMSATTRGCCTTINRLRPPQTEVDLCTYSVPRSLQQGVSGSTSVVVSYKNPPGINCNNIPPVSDYERISVTPSEGVTSCHIRTQLLALQVWLSVHLRLLSQGSYVTANCMSCSQFSTFIHSIISQ